MILLRLIRIILTRIADPDLDLFGAEIVRSDPDPTIDLYVDISQKICPFPKFLFNFFNYEFQFQFN